MSDPSTTRAPADRCPGLLRPFLADDGALVRLRMPGGRVAPSVLSEVVAIAERFGAPVVQMTSRGNLQVRALPSPLPPAFVEAIEATGLLPSATHERVRNVVAAPLARELDGMVAAFDAALVADPVLARLPGRFLFAFSDASGSVLSERWDIAYQQFSADSGVVYAGGLASEVALGDAVPAMIDAARRFVEIAPEGAWNVRDLPPTLLPDLLPSWDTPREAPKRPNRAIRRPLRPGVVGPDVVAGVPLGMLTRQHVAAFAEVAGPDAPAVVTAWRSVVVRDGAARVDVLRDAGLVIEAAGPWSRLSACVGAPSCRRTTVPTLDLARSAAELVAARRLPSTQDVHVVGCERRCGTGVSDHVLVAPPTVDHVVTSLTQVPIGGET
ncbi:cobalamin biosynthesis protein CobG [Knoellia subterranea]|uniref:cobalamin biosynthesis protein CobG n=1 Tax=Knoellia subterranea TaxID=184882 RepID=UPI001FDF641F|nr:cobalamin biosynthesis protein CobG [Knoellia subterranea]